MWRRIVAFRGEASGLRAALNCGHEHDASHVMGQGGMPARLDAHVGRPVRCIACAR
ncbi:MAG: hypothetical protein LC624_10510 [Halobacteriales archaeon]|nr:hypothetical protein [Halobacteriales archaeon]